MAAQRYIVHYCADGADAVARALDVLPDLIIIDPGIPGRDGWRATRALRALPPPLGDVPILCYSVDSPDAVRLRDAGFDGVLRKPCDPDTLATAIAPWTPSGAMAGVARLAGVFGAAEIAALVARFRDQLGEALAGLDRGTNRATDRATAHRIAGIAGTLGFVRVGQSFLALSEGDETMRAVARRDARAALHQIDRAGPDPLLP